MARKSIAVLLCLATVDPELELIEPQTLYQLNLRENSQAQNRSDATGQRRKFSVNQQGKAKKNSAPGPKPAILNRLETAIRFDGLDSLIDRFQEFAIVESDGESIFFGGQR